MIEKSYLFLDLKPDKPSPWIYSCTFLYLNVRFSKFRIWNLIRLAPLGCCLNNCLLIHATTFLYLDIDFRYVHHSRFYTSNLKKRTPHDCCLHSAFQFILQIPQSICTSSCVFSFTINFKFTASYFTTFCEIKILLNCFSLFSTGSIGKYNPNWNQWLPVEETDNGLRLNGVYQSQKINLSPRNLFLVWQMSKIEIWKGIFPSYLSFDCFEGGSPVLVFYLFWRGDFLVFILYLFWRDVPGKNSVFL